MLMDLNYGLSLKDNLVKKSVGPGRQCYILATPLVTVITIVQHVKATKEKGHYLNTGRVGSFKK